MTSQTNKVAIVTGASRGIGAAVAAAGDAADVQAGAVDTDVRVAHVSGDTRWVEMRISGRVNAAGIRGWVVNFREVTDRKRLEDELRHQARTDPLTGLFNRRGLELSFAALRLGASIDLSQQFALVLMDLDHFKTLNDTHGHAAGDAMLREVAVRLNAATRAEDTIARTGGDEFVLLLPHFADAERLKRLGQRIVASIEQPFDFNGTICRISVSLGGALSTDYPCLDWAAMQAAADDALYRAKRAGRGCLRIAGHGSD